jgi:hypothetical protein
MTSFFLGLSNHVAQPLLERLFFTMSIAFIYIDVRQMFWQAAYPSKHSTA